MMGTKWQVSMFACIVLFLLLLGIILAIVLTMPSEYSNESVSNAYNRFGVNDSVPIVISFTTMPKRLQSRTFELALIFMMKQKPRPQQIFINIPYKLKKSGETYEIPMWLQELANRDQSIVLNRCEDEGPATKYLPTLRHFLQRGQLNQRIFVYDDDSLMAPDTLRLCMVGCEEFPNAVICAQGARLGAEFPQSVAQLWKELIWISSKTVTVPTSVQFVEGHIGYCITPKMFVDESSDADDYLRDLKTQLCDWEAWPSAAFFVDDVVMSAALARRHVDRLVYPQIKLKLINRGTYWEQLQKLMSHAVDSESLSTNVNASGNNDFTVLQYFRDIFVADKVI